MRCGGDDGGGTGTGTTDRRCAGSTGRRAEQDKTGVWITPLLSPRPVYSFPLPHTPSRDTEAGLARAIYSRLIHSMVGQYTTTRARVPPRGQAHDSRSSSKSTAPPPAGGKPSYHAGKGCCAALLLVLGWAGGGGAGGSSSRREPGMLVLRAETECGWPGCRSALFHPPPR